MQNAHGWFRVLPKLRDRAAAMALVREARNSSAAQRLGLMQEFSYQVGIGSMLNGDIDEAFARWLAQRRK